MTTLKALAGLLVAAILATSVVAAVSKPIALQLKLPAKPPFTPPQMIAPLAAGPIAVDVVDARGAGDPAVVGACREKGKDVYLWSVGQPAAPAVKDLATKLLKTWSVRVAPEADYGLKLALTRFYVTERSETFGSTYVADVGLKVSLVDRTGAVVWAGEAAGTATRPGVDGRASMCNEALSIALRQALAKAIADAALDAAKPVAPMPIDPEALLADLLRLKAGGVTDEVLVGYVGQRSLGRPLTVDDILRWKSAGIPDAAIKAATRP